VDKNWENPVFVSDSCPQAVDKNPYGTSHHMEWILRGYPHDNQSRHGLHGQYL
jgi:hypothetical protein